MSIEHLTVGTNCVTWSNLKFPEPDETTRSSDFHFDGSDWYFEVSHSWHEKSDPRTNFHVMQPVLNCVMRSCNNTSHSYIIVPYSKSKETYHRIPSESSSAGIMIWSLSSIVQSGMESNTVVFFFFRDSLSIQRNSKEACSGRSKERKPLGQAPVQSVYLENLSEDIGPLFDNEKHADVTLKCGDSTFSVHRNILAARSEVFSAMFDHDMAERNSGEVTIDEIEEAVMKEFLQFLYSGRLGDMTMDSAVDLYRVGDKYAVTSLKELCSSCILRNLTKELVCSILLMADDVGDEKFLNSVANFAIEQDMFLKSKEWKSFALQHSKVAVKVYLRVVNKFC